MTALEAFARACELWPDHGPLTVEPLPGCPGEWLVESAGRPHLMDADGNPTCHRDCILRAREVAA
jgi:hypothetical protein